MKKEQEELIDRREYLISLKKWSKVVIGSVLFGGVLSGTHQQAEAGGWVNNRGGGRGWVNNHEDDGGGWVNNRGGGRGWVNNHDDDGGSWVNNRGGWIDRNSGGANWVNRNY